MKPISTLLILAATLLVAALPAPARAADRPNMVVFLSDDHGIDFVGCYGNSTIQTPHIDRLATEGTLFTKMFAASPTCAPSRAVIYSGQHSARNGLMGNHTACRPDLKTLPHYLGALGYRVALANKLHVKPESVVPFEMVSATLPRDPAKQRRYRLEGLDVDAIDRFLAGHVAEHSDQPLCLILADSSPHVTWEKNHTYDPETIPVHPLMVDTPKTRTALANYYQDITTMDLRVGRVLESLDRHGLRDDTLFIYTTDQGAEWPRSKWTVYDSGIHVPFIARWPGHIEPQTTSGALLSFVDVLPTFIELAGGEPPEGIDGRSFVDVLVGKSHTFNEYVFASHTRDGDMNVFPQRGVRDGRYKYVLNLIPENKWTTHFTKVMDIPDSHGDVYSTWTEKAQSDPAAARLVERIEWHPAVEFYDTTTDPYELNNLADRPEFADKRAEMRRALVDWIEQQQDTDALAALKQ